MSKKFVPKLRFPEFSGPWHEASLGRLAQKVSERVGTGACVPYTVTSGVGLMSQDAKFGRQIAGKSLSSYVRLRRDDFAYNKSATKAFPEGYIARYIDDLQAAVPNSIFTCFRVDPAMVEPVYLDFLFASNLHGRWLRKLLTVGARAHGSLNVSDDDLFALPVPLPSMPEQRKIAGCLSSLDVLIAAESLKLESLRKLKKGLLQNLFPREGETTPRLRFPEFRNDRQWRATTVGEHVDLLSGFPFDGNDIVEDPTGVPLMRGINITEGHIRHDPQLDRFYLGSVHGLERYKLREGDLVIGMDGSKVGRNSALISAADDGALLVQRVARLRSDNHVTVRFIYALVNSTRFHAYVDRVNTSSGIPHISAKQIKDFALAMPSQAEQQRIAASLTSIDSIIHAQAKKLDILNLHKQGLMHSLLQSPLNA